MNASRTKSGLTLVEMAAVMGIMALLAVLSMPAIKGLINSFNSDGSTRGMIGAALSNARAMAIKQQKYVGVRFQEDITGSQYMIFIVHDPNLYDDDGFTNISKYKETYGFRALDGIMPIKLPENSGVLEYVDLDVDIDTDIELGNKKIFTVVFSQDGKLVQHKAPVLRLNNYDIVFNGVGAASGVVWQFTDDYYDATPYIQEYSRREFIIYDKLKFKNINAGTRCTDYLNGLDIVRINAYTGKLIKSGQ